MSQILNTNSTSPILDIVIEDFRAIKSAKISINGISVIAGENGCGKSTISKLVYYLYKTISNYDLLIGKNIKESLGDVFRFLEISIQEFFTDKISRSQKLDFRKELSQLSASIAHNYDPHASYQEFNDFFEKLKYSISLLQNGNIAFSDRLKYIAQDITGNKGTSLFESNSSSHSYNSPFDIISEYSDNIFKEYLGLLKSRNARIFKTELREVFHDSALPKKFQVYEYGTEIISLNRNYLSIPFVIQNVIYIDTPMMLGIETFDYNHWEDLNDILKSNSGTKRKNTLADLISNDIIGGEASYDDSFVVDEYLFKRKDGSIFNLLDCATGIKSFSIIQLLLKNNRLDDKTLLIIDEPESNLHPQWIIEYARLIVLLNKNVGIKFLLASHNPDMVSAIKIIAEKEGNIANLNYYLGENKGNFQYEFKELKTNIDPIFASFNIAFERINLYGSN